MSTLPTTGSTPRSNRNRVFRCVYQTPEGITKLELSQKLGLSMPTVLQNVKSLLADDVLCFGDTAQSTGGRKARRLRVNASLRFSIGVCVTSRSLRFIAVDLCLNELAYEKVSYVGNGLPQGEIVSALKEFLQRCRLPQEKLLGVGIAFPGLLREADDLLVVAPTLHVRQISLAPLRSALSCPVYFVNDANAGGFAEWWNAPDAENLLYLSVDKGVGGAILLRGVPYPGDNGRSAELGHMCLQPEGPVCSCGKRGCFEALCSIDRMSEDLGISLDEFFVRLQGGDAQCMTVWQQYLSHLAFGIYNLYILLDCTVVVGGLLAQYLEPYLPALQAHLAQRSPFAESETFPLRLCHHRSKGACTGAALHFVQAFLAQL